MRPVSLERGWSTGEVSLQALLDGENQMTKEILFTPKDDYRDSATLEMDAILVTREGRWAAFEIKRAAKALHEHAW